MQTAKLFTNGNSQAVRLPKEYRFTGSEVKVLKLGKLVVLCPQENENDIFFSSLGKFPQEFYDSIQTARAEAIPSHAREIL